MSSTEFSPSPERDAYAMIKGVLAYARSVIDRVRAIDASKGALDDDPRLETRTAEAYLRKQESDISRAKGLLNEKKKGPMEGHDLKEIEERLKDTEEKLACFKRDLGNVRTLSEKALEMRQLVRQATQAMRQISNSEKSMRNRSLQVDLMLASELEKLAGDISDALAGLSGLEGYLMSIRDIPQLDVSAPLLDLDRFQGDLERCVASLTEEGATAAVGTEKTAVNRHRTPDRDLGPTQFEGQWDKPPKHPKFGNAMSANEVESATTEFFTRLWKEGIPQSRATDIMFSKTSYTEGLTVHDALAYARGVDALNKSITELKIKYLR